MGAGENVWIEAQGGSSTSSEEGRRDTGGGWSAVPKGKRRRVPLHAEALESQIQSLLSLLSRVFDQPDKEPGTLRVNELEIMIDINAEGQVALIGSGAKNDTQVGAIKIKLTRD
ncbi:hypothetical protein U2F10_21755 [Leptothoe sp. EHU-05/26/07-4]